MYRTLHFGNYRGPKLAKLHRAKERHTPGLSQSACGLSLAENHLCPVHIIVDLWPIVPGACCHVSRVPAGWECSEKLRRVGNNGCKAVLTGNRGEYLRVVGIHSDG